MDGHRIYIAPVTTPYRVLRHRDYRLILTGNFIGTIGLQMQSTAVGWDLYVRTHSAYALAMVGLVQVLPLFALVLPAGHYVDTHDRRGVLMVSQGGFALASLGLAFVSWREAPVATIYLSILMLGISRAFYAPARTALIPTLVPTEEFSHAVTWNSGSFQLASVLGPGAAGLIIAHLGGPLTVYLTAACCSVVFFVQTVMLRHREPPRRVHDITFPDLVAGVRFVARTPLILATITLDLFAVLLGGANALLPIYAKDILHVGAAGFGWLEAAASIGAVMMAVTLASRPPLKHAGPTLLWAVTGFGVGTLIFGISHSYVLSLAMQIAIGACDMISVVVRSTLVPLLTPDNMRGRVGAINTLFIGTSNQLGDFESGMVAGAFGPVVSVVSGAIGTLLVIGAASKIWPQLRSLGRLDQLAPLPVTDETEAPSDQWRTAPESTV